MKVGHENFMKRGKLPVLCAAVLTLVLTVTLAVHSDAGEENALKIQINEITPSGVFYAIQSDRTYKNALLLVAAYDADGDMADFKAEIQSVTPGTHTDRKIFASTRFENVIIYLLDPETWVPLCEAGEWIHQVTFVDYDGTLLSAQEVRHRQAAFTPENPRRDGYVFTGWDKNYQDVQEDAVIRACYAAEGVENIFSVSSAAGNVNDKVTVRVNLGGNVLLSGFDIRLLYDGSVLEYVSTDSELSMDILDRHMTDEQYITFNYLSAAGNRTSGGAIADVTFRIKNKNQSSTALQLFSSSVVCVSPEYGGNPVPTIYALKEGIISIK